MKLSIVIPTYNRAKVFPRAVKSVTKQTYTNWELIIVDDGSTDDTQTVVGRLQTKDRRIRYLRLPANRGFYAARNRGVEKASGDWVCFLDSDDEYLPGALAAITDELDKVDKKIGVAQFMLVAHSKTGKEEKLGFRCRDANWDYYQPTYEEIVLKKDLKQDMHRCVRRKVAQKCPYSEANPGLENLHYANLAKAGVQFLYVNRPVVWIHQDEFSHNQVRFKKWPRKFARAYAELIMKHSIVFQKQKQHLFDHQVRIMRCYLVACDPRFLWWAGRAFFNQPQKFVDGIKRALKM